MVQGSPEGNAQGGIPRRLLAGMRELGETKEIIMDENIGILILKRLDEIRSFSLLSAKSVLNMDDVVLLTGLSKGYIYKLTCKKEIPCYKPDGKILYFDRQEIESWMKRNKQEVAIDK